MITKLKTYKNLNKTYKLYSFDIFDTLITRTVAEPSGIFAIMQKELIECDSYKSIPEFVRQNFYTLRVEAESYIRTNKFLTEERQEISLSEIYEIIKNSNNLSNKDIETLTELEIRTEIKNLKPINKNINYLKSLINEGNRVILISDMYHSSEVLRHILLTIDTIFENIKIYVSSEFNKTKHFGDLYSIVQKLEKVEPSAWQHVGDNRLADIKQAKNKSINTKWCPQEELLRYEQKALEKLNGDFYIESLVGIARLTRIQKENKSPAYILGSSYSGPILYNYVCWILNQAISRGIKTLNFIARDGYVLKCIADIIIQKKELDIKTNYIYGSRAAWRIPDKSNIDEFISWVCEEYSDRLNLEFLAKRLSIELDVLKNFTKISNAKKVFKSKQIKKLKTKLLSNTELIKYLIDINNSKKELLKEYLISNLNLSDNTIAFVDVNGSGRTQDMLANIIKEFYNGEIVGFYYHTCFNCDQTLTKKLAYISTERFFDHTIELFCRNLDGQTLGYQKKENTIKPILEDIDTTALIKWGYEDYLQSLKDFTSNACEFEKVNNNSLLSFALYKIYFDYLKTDLDKQTANTIGSIPFMDVGSEKDTTECAPKYDFKFLLKFLFKRKKYASMLSLNFISAKRSAKIFNFLLSRKNNITLLQQVFSIRNSKDKLYKIITICGFKIKFSRL